VCKNMSKRQSFLAVLAARNAMFKRLMNLAYRAGTGEQITVDDFKRGVEAYRRGDALPPSRSRNGKLPVSRELTDLLRQCIEKRGWDWSAPSIDDVLGILEKHDRTQQQAGLRRRLGRSMAMFGSVHLFWNLAAAIAVPSGRVSIGLVDLYFVSAGLAFYRGKRKSITWPAIWLGLRCFAGLVFFRGMVICAQGMTQGNRWWFSTTAIHLLTLVWSITLLRGLLKLRGMEPRTEIPNKPVDGD